MSDLHVRSTCRGLKPAKRERLVQGLRIAQNVPDKQLNMASRHLASRSKPRDQISLIVETFIHESFIAPLSKTRFFQFLIIYIVQINCCHGALSSALALCLVLLRCDGDQG